MNSQINNLTAKLTRRSFFVRFLRFIAWLCILLSAIVFAGIVFAYGQCFAGVPDTCFSGIPLLFGGLFILIFGGAGVLILLVTRLRSKDNIS